MARRPLALACAFALAFALVPSQALAAVADDAARDAAAQGRAERIDAASGSYEPGQMIVVFRDSAHGGAAEAARSLEQALPGSAAEPLSETSAVQGGGASATVRVPDGMTVGQAIVAAERCPEVLFAQPNHVYRPLDGRTSRLLAATQPSAAQGTAALGLLADALLGETSPQAQEATQVNDPYARVSTQSSHDFNQWWLYSVRAFDAWGQMGGLAADDDEKVTVAVLDTGTNFQHEDLQGALVSDYAFDAVKMDRLAESADDEEMAHGCHVSGIVAGVANNGVGMAGMGGNYARVLPIRVFKLQYSMYGWTAACDDADLIRAYDYLLSTPAGASQTVAQLTNTRVVNMSLGGYLADDPEEGYDYAFEAKIAEAQAAGILTVAAGGNGDSFGNARTDASYPSDFPDVVSVVALANDATRATWSDYNPHKDICAPGSYITSTYFDGPADYQIESGTSMASPIVAACAALLFACDPDLTVGEAKEALFSTAEPLGQADYASGVKDARYAWGKVNPAAALADVASARIVVQSATMTRTSTQQLGVKYTMDSAEHDWTWGVSDEAVATVSADGVLTARTAGTVTVTVRDSADASICGERVVAVREIELPAAPTVVADGVGHALSVSWQAADCAVAYRVLRAVEEGGPYAEIAEVDAEGVLSHADEDTRPGVEYWYRIVPVGLLEGEPAVGAESEAVRGYYTDKTGLAEQIVAARQLRTDTAVSADGSDVATDAWWVARADRQQLDKALRVATDMLYNDSVLQDAIDAAAADLLEACADFEAARSHGTYVDPDAKPADPDEGGEGGEGAGDGGSGAGDGSNAGDGANAGGGAGDSSGGDANGGSGAGPDSGAGSGSGADDGSDAGSGTGSSPDAGSGSDSNADAGSGVGSDSNNPASGAGADAGDASGSGEKPGPGSASGRSDAPAGQANAMYRLYNPNSGEHFYTADLDERHNLVGAGWDYEGVAWNAPAGGGDPVFRLYNPNAGDHHYTTSGDERDFLVGAGWDYEGVGWLSAPASAGTPLYRLYNPNAQTGAHHYTTDRAERDYLTGAGWQDEGVAWYGM